VSIIAIAGGRICDREDVEFLFGDSSRDDLVVVLRSRKATPPTSGVCVSAFWPTHDGLLQPPGFHATLAAL
jgi:hypothetical protein